MIYKRTLYLLKESFVYSFLRLMLVPWTVILFSTFLKIAAVSWILLTYFELMANTKIFCRRQILLIPYIEVNNKNTRTRPLTLSGVFIVNFEKYFTSFSIVFIVDVDVITDVIVDAKWLQGICADFALVLCNIFISFNPLTTKPTKWSNIFK